MKNLSKTMLAVLAIGLLSCSFFCQQAEAAPIPFFYNNDFPNNLIGTASRPESTGKIEIESADDFLPISTRTLITSGTFTGLIPTGATIGAVRVEIYRVFPNDSNTMRTPNVVTRVNSPADVAFADRDTGSGNLSFTTTLLNAKFTALNSILNGINPSPNQFTGGEGPVTGQEVQFTVNFLTPFSLPADHYFFIPQVELAGADDNFFWLSATRPLVPPSTVFAPDLQSWIRDANLDPDWSRIGTDIVDGNPAPTFNGSFSLTGTVVPDSGSTVALLGLALAGVEVLRRKRKAA
jgi:VPDSG-CTERM motif